jgi:hypothetical protein
MKKFLFTFFLISAISNSFCANFIPCRLVFKDNTTKFGYANIPNMADKSIEYKENTNSVSDKILSDALIEIVFNQNDKNVCYQRILTYKNFGNKKVSKRKSWLKVIKTGYVSFYYGFQPGINSPSINMWYCKKVSDSIAYYISGKYSGGLVLTIGTEHDFKKNSSIYLGDNNELVDKILKSEYKFEDIEFIIEKYNEWKGEK